MNSSPLAQSDVSLSPPLAVTRSHLLSAAPDVVHGITGRQPGLGRADGNIGYSAPRDVDDAWQMRQRWCGAIGVAAERLVTAGQVHGTTIRHVRRDNAGSGAKPGAAQIGDADALMTDEAGVVLMTLHADCVPIFLVDPKRPAITVVHAGWRGTVGDIAGLAIQAMGTSFGSQPTDILAFLGPAIGPCCYEVGDEVATAWHATGADGEAERVLRPTGERWHFNLHAANALLLARAGLPMHHLETSPVCTRCAAERWFSHRGQGGATGRFGAIISLRDDCPGAAPELSESGAAWHLQQP